MISTLSIEGAKFFNTSLHGLTVQSSTVKTILDYTYFSSKKRVMTKLLNFVFSYLRGLKKTFATLASSLCPLRELINIVWIAAVAMLPRNDGYEVIYQ